MSNPSAAERTRDEPGRLFWLSLPVGIVMIAIGVRGIVHEHARTQPAGLARWFVAAGIVHDALLAPAFVAIGLLSRRLPDVARVPVRVALAMSALLTAFAWPMVQAWGHRSDEPSLLPLDYGRNLIGALVVIWLVAAACIGVQVRRGAQ